LFPFQALYTSGASPPAPAPVPTPALALAPFIAAARSAANRRPDHDPDHYIAGGTATSRDRRAAGGVSSQCRPPHRCAAADVAGGREAR